MSILTLYLLSILDSVIIACLFGALACVLISIISGVLSKETYDKAGQNYHLCNMKKFATYAVILIILSALTPSTKQAYMIAGGYFVTNIEDIEKLPEDTVKAARKFLETYVEEELDVSNINSKK
jgi:hypothetical protein